MILKQLIKCLPSTNKADAEICQAVSESRPVCVTADPAPGPVHHQAQLTTALPPVATATSSTSGSRTGTVTVAGATQPWL